MATSAGELFVRVRPDTRDFGRELNREVEGAGRSAGQLLTDFISVGAVTAGFSQIIGAASDLEQAIGGTTAVFGQAEATITDFAEGADKSAGLTQAAARTLTTQIGSLLQGFEFTQEEAANTSVELAQLGADLSAITGAGSAEEAIQALGAALRGEYDPLERFSVAINTTQANLKAVELGLAESTSAVDQNARAQATLALIYERAAFAANGFANEADTAAGAAAIAGAEAGNAAADLGENFLPIYTEVAEVVGGAAEAFSALPDSVQTASVVVGAAGILAGPVVRTYRDVSDAVKSTSDRFRNASPRARSFARGLGTVGAAAGGVFAAAQAVELLLDNIYEGRFGDASTQADRLADAISRVADEGLTGALEENFDGLTGAFERTQEVLAEDAPYDAVADKLGFLGDAAQAGRDRLRDLGTDSDEAAAELDALDSVLAELIRQNPEEGVRQFEALQGAFEGAGIDARLFQGVLDESTGVINDYREGALGAADATAEAGDAAEDVALGDMKDLGSAIGDVVSEFDALDDAVFGKRDAELDLESARLSEERANLDVADRAEGIHRRDPRVRGPTPERPRTPLATTSRPRSTPSAPRSTWSTLSGTSTSPPASRPTSSTTPRFRPSAATSN